MCYVDMDNILCSNCNFQETNRKKHRKRIKNKMNTNLEKHFDQSPEKCQAFLRHPLLYS